MFTLLYGGMQTYVHIEEQKLTLIFSLWDKRDFFPFWLCFQEQKHVLHPSKLQ